MNIYLIKTPEYSKSDYETVLALLRSFPGPINFLSSINGLSTVNISLQDQMLDPNKSLDHQKRNSINEQGDKFPFRWEMLFNFCRQFRKNQAVSNDDFVILLTNINNGYNWFSMFDGSNNAFVDCMDWERFTSAASQYPIAYEIVANIFRTLLRAEMVLPNPFFHEVARGCMNDLCLKKADISLKLRTGDVCPVCIEGLELQGVNELILDHGLAIFEGIRKQLLFKAGARSAGGPGIIELTDHNKIYFRGIGNLELKLFPLDKTLYVFYLNHLEGVRLNELNDHCEELLALYRRFSVADTNEKINASITDLINPFGGSFSQKKSRINRAISKLLGDRHANFYQISGPAGESFKINISVALVQLPEDRFRGANW